MAVAHQWLGFRVHGFDGPEALAYSMDNAGHRHALGVEVCAKLMNGHLYVNQDPPADDGDHKEFENVVVSAQGYEAMILAAGANQGVFFGYKPQHILGTMELPATELKVNHHTSLPCWEINGGAKFRRRIILPRSLMEPGATRYHFLEYKSLPNLEFRARASILAEREAAAAAAAAAAPPPPAAQDAAQDAAAHADYQDAAAHADHQDAAAHADHQDAAPAVDPPLEDVLENYNSSSDEDYQPDEEDEQPEDHVFRVTNEGYLDD